MRTDPKRHSSKRRERRAPAAPSAPPVELGTEPARLVLELARGRRGDWRAQIRHVCQLEAEVIHVERVSFWSLHEHGSRLSCDAGFVASSRSFEHGATLQASGVPYYFKALREARVLNVEDVLGDPRTRGLGDYCASRGVSSMLDVPVWVEGQLRGVLCHEHVGPRREWSGAEEEFAVSAGQVIASALQARAHTRAEVAVRRAGLLDDLSRVALSSLDAREIVRRALDRTVPEFADVAFVWALEPDGALECIGAIHADPRKQPLVDRLAQTPALSKVVSRQKQSLLLPAFSPAVLDSFHVGPERAALEELGITSGIGVPLAAAGKTIGAMSFLVAGRRYDSRDGTLAEEIGGRVAAALENARLYGTAQEAIRARDDFLVLVTHELRTPLAAMQLMTDDMLRRARRSANADDLKRSDALAAQVRRFGGVVEHVIEASCIRADGVDLTLGSCDLEAVLTHCVEQLADRARRAGSSVTVTEAASIVGRFDAARLQRVLLILLDNAVKFGQGRPIEVSLRRDGAEAELTVRD